MTAYTRFDDRIKQEAKRRGWTINAMVEYIFSWYFYRSLEDRWEEIKRRDDDTIYADLPVDYDCISIVGGSTDGQKNQEDRDVPPER